MKFISALDHTAFSFILRMVNSSPVKRIKVDEWDWLAVVQVSGLPLFCCVASAGLFSFICFQQLLSFPDSELIHHWGSLKAECCVPFSADLWASREGLIKWRPLCEPVRNVANVTLSKASTCSLLFCSDNSPPPAARSFGPKASSTFVRKVGRMQS